MEIIWLLKGKRKIIGLMEDFRIKIVYRIIKFRFFKKKYW